MTSVRVVSARVPSAQGASLQEASRQEASLQEASPQEASPQEASPQEASPQGASPQGASLQEASLQGPSVPRRVVAVPRVAELGPEGAGAPQGPVRAAPFPGGLTSAQTACGANPAGAQDLVVRRVR